MTLDFSFLVIEHSTTWVDVLFSVLFAISIIIFFIFNFIREPKWQHDDDQYIP